MNQLKLNGLKVSGKAYIQRKGDLDMELKSPLEQIVENEEKEGAIEKTENIAVPAAEPVLEKHAIEDIVEEGPEAIVEPATTVETEQVELKQSKKKGFDPRSTTNAVHADDEDNDGGVMANKMAVPQDAEGSQYTPPGANEVENDTKNKYEVTGFNVQYRPKGSKGIASEAVRDYYDTLKEAMERFEKENYTKPDGIVAYISTGAPEISFNERTIKTYINEEWKSC